MIQGIRQKIRQNQFEFFFNTLSIKVFSVRSVFKKYERRWNRVKLLKIIRLINMGMSTNSREEILIEQEVTYTLEINGKFFIIENVPARVCVETGEHFFAPETVERLSLFLL